MHCANVSCYNGLCGCSSGIGAASGSGFSIHVSHGDGFFLSPEVLTVLSQNSLLCWAVKPLPAMTAQLEETHRTKCAMANVLFHPGLNSLDEMILKSGRMCGLLKRGFLSAATCKQTKWSVICWIMLKHALLKWIWLLRLSCFSNVHAACFRAPGLADVFGLEEKSVVYFNHQLH